MVFSERVQAITYNEIMPTIVDFVNNSNIFTARMMSNVKNWRGVNIKQPIRIANSTTGGSFDGLDTFDTSTTNDTRSLTWYVKAYEQTAVIPGIEKAVNGTTDKQVVSLVADRLDQAKISLTQALGDLLYGIGAGKDFDGLGLIVDDGTVSPEYGGLSRETTPGNKAEVSTLGGSFTLDLLAGMFSRVSSAGIKKESPTILLTTKAIWDKVEALMRPQIHANYETTSVSGYNQVSGKSPMGQVIPATELKGASGFTAISYRGVPLVADEKCTEGTLFLLNERYLDFHRLISKDLKSISSNPTNTEGPDAENNQPSFLQLRDWMSPVNQFGEIGALIVMGNLICRQPRRQGKITNIK